jgi:quercetin dioxygenase-like cupin family protein
MNESKKSLSSDKVLNADGVSNIDGCDAVVLPQATDGEAESVELLRTCQSWDGADLPDYPQGQPELVAIKYIIPPGKKLNWHHHLVMNHGVLVQGELTIIALDGKTKVMRAGDVVVEMVDTIHHGENRSTEPVVLYMFYLSQKDKPLSVQHPELPL